MIVRGLAVALLAVTLGGCSHVGAMWGKMTGHHDDAAPAAAAAAPASAETCATLRANASPGSTADPASRQMAIDEMKRSGCPDIPAP